MFDENGGIPLEEVEPVDSIVKRFKTGAMSYGSISEEAHKCLAAAMNQLGGKSIPVKVGNCQNAFPLSIAVRLNRWLPAVLVLPANIWFPRKRFRLKWHKEQNLEKVDTFQGKKGISVDCKNQILHPWCILDFPPPHHDIYSIEDLAQLIYDLKNANHNADISVKLVSEAGVGTIAAGVAKAGASVVLISGYDGGTGAALEIRFTMLECHGTWTFEAHQTLMKNGLRSRVRIETDGKLASGRDAAIACMLGAEEFGFATAPLVTMGCMMMRVCNLDTCPFGIATQNPELRKRFSGKPECVVNFMRFIAEELREIMAHLGIRCIDDLVGRTDLLKKGKTPPHPVEN